MNLPLDRPRDHAVDDVPLQEHEHDHRGQYGQHHGGQGVVPLGVQRADEVVGGQHQRLGGRGAVHHQQRQQEVVPDPHHVQHHHGGGDGLEQREDDPQVGLEGGGPVDHGALVDLGGDGFHEVEVDERGHRYAEAPVLYAQAPGGAVQVDDVHELQQGDHDGLEGDQHRGDDEGVQRLGHPGLAAVQYVGRHGRERHDARDADQRDDHVVEEQAEVFHLLDDIGIVRPLQVAGQRQHVGQDLLEGLQRIAHHQENRVDVQARQQHDHDQEQGVGGDAPTRGLNLVHHCCTSRLLKDLQHHLGQHQHDHEEHERLGRAQAVVVVLEGLAVDVQRGGVGRAAGAALGQRQYDVEHLQRIGQRHEHAGGDGGAQQGQRHPEEALAAGGAVDAGRLQHLLGNGLQAGDVQHDIEAQRLPGAHDHQRPEGQLAVAQPAQVPNAPAGQLVQLFKALGEYELPDEAHDGHGHDVGQEEHAPQEVGQLEFLRQRHGQRQRQHVAEHDEQRGILEREHQRVHEFRAARGKDGFEVGEPDEHRVPGYAVPLRQRIIAAHDEGDVDGDEHHDHRRQREEQRLLQRLAVHRAHGFLVHVLALLALGME